VRTFYTRKRGRVGTRPDLETSAAVFALGASAVQEDNGGDVHVA
jgi:hypothetical protein